MNKNVKKARAGLIPESDFESVHLMPTVIEACEILKHLPCRSDIRDRLVVAVSQMKEAIDEASNALAGDSNDAEHDALVSLMGALGVTIPERTDD